MIYVHHGRGRTARNTPSGATLRDPSRASLVTTSSSTHPGGTWNLYPYISRQAYVEPPGVARRGLKLRKQPLTQQSTSQVGCTYEYYPIHPVTVDASLQAACLSDASGHAAALRTFLAVFIAEAHIQPSMHPAQGHSAPE
ncbi:hypothetical protein F5B17DRAFT_311253 [Nemania serpens]|nr:hypothetical protein F5B17DRAFT_311253 [Nemania serpens]